MTRNKEIKIFASEGEVHILIGLLLKLGQSTSCPYRHILDRLIVIVLLLLPVGLHLGLGVVLVLILDIQQVLHCNEYHWWWWF